MKILVTGTAGFIGSHLAHRLLDRGDEVIGVDNVNDYYDVNLKEARLARLTGKPGFTEVRQDVADREAMAALFGNFEMVGELDALGAPAPRVIAYRPPSNRKRANLDAFPRRIWLRASPDLWMSHDGESLLLAPTRQIVFENLTRRRA